MYPNWIFNRFIKFPLAKTGTTEGHLNILKAMFQDMHRVQL